MKYRKKPVEVEARQVTRENVVDIADWVRSGGYPAVALVAPETIALDIATLEGTMTALEGDYVICGVAGEFYPCKPDIFEATYEEQS